VIARLGGLLLVLGTMVFVQRVGPPHSTSTVMLPLGFALIAAYLLGLGAERLRLPRLSGYLLFGLLCGPYLLNLITTTMALDLQIVNGFALALIALVAGLELNLLRVRAQLRAVVIVGFGIMLGAVLILTILLWAAWPHLPLGDAGTGLSRLAAAVLTAALVVSFSPTVTIAVITESRARGSYTELLMAIVIVADLLLILIFALGLQFARWTTASMSNEVSVSVQLSWDILGSLAFGGIIGAAFAFYLRTIGREVTLALLAVCALLAVVAPLLHLELILAALAAGLVVENIAPPEGDSLREAIEKGALPVLVAFFAATGASLQLDVLAALGLTALMLAAVRFGLIWAIGDVIVRGASLADTPARLVWMGLISQAGVTLGLAAIVADQFPLWGQSVRTLVVALTGFHVLVGPILLRAALLRTGDVAGASAPATTR
jgi:Kef-type K+ transport system membrane component KefB